MRWVNLLFLFLLASCYSIPLQQLPIPQENCQLTEPANPKQRKTDYEKLKLLTCPIEIRATNIIGTPVEDSITFVLEDFEKTPAVTLALSPEIIDNVPDLVDRAIVRGRLPIEAPMIAKVTMRPGRYYGKATIESVLLHPPFYSTWSSLNIYFGYSKPQGTKLKISNVTQCHLPSNQDLLGLHILCPPLDVSIGKPNIMRFKLSKSEHVSGSATGIIYLITIAGVFYGGPFAAVIPVIFGPVGTQKDIQLSRPH